MFKKISSPKKKSIKKRKPLPPHYEVLTADVVLANKKVHLLVERIKTLVHISDEYWDMLYLPIIKAYFAFVQGLPAIKYTAFNKHNGYLELGIRRVIESLVAYRKNHPVKDLKPEEIPATEARWTYAVFTSAFFYGLGQIIATYWVSMCNNKGFHSSRWNPFAGNMLSQGTHYRYSFEAINRDTLANHSTPIIAKDLMPKEGFVWLSEDKELLEAWLAFLQNDIERGGLVAKIILPIEHEILQLPLMDSSLIEFPSDEIAQDNIEQNNKDKVLTNEEVINKFVDWLRNEIDGSNMRAGSPFGASQPNAVAHFTLNGVVLLFPYAFVLFLQNFPEFGIDDMLTITQALSEANFAEKYHGDDANEPVKIIDPTILGERMQAPSRNAQITATTDSYPTIKQQANNSLKNN